MMIGNSENKGYLSGFLEGNASIDVCDFKAVIGFKVLDNDVRIYVDEVKDRFVDRLRKGVPVSFIYEKAENYLKVDEKSVLFSN